MSVVNPNKVYEKTKLEEAVYKFRKYYVTKSAFVPHTKRKMIDDVANEAELEIPQINSSTRRKSVYIFETLDAANWWKDESIRHFKLQEAESNMLLTGATIILGFFKPKVGAAASALVSAWPFFKYKDGYDPKKHGRIELGVGEKGRVVFDTTYRLQIERDKDKGGRDYVSTEGSFHVAKEVIGYNGYNSELWRMRLINKNLHLALHYDELQRIGFINLLTSWVPDSVRTFNTNVISLKDVPDLNTLLS